VFNVQTIKNGIHLLVALAQVDHLILALLVIIQLKVNVQLFLILSGQIVNAYVDLASHQLDSNVFALVLKLMIFVISAHINQTLN
jgi:hypothetical protein